MSFEEHFEMEVLVQDDWFFSVVQIRTLFKINSIDQEHISIKKHLPTEFLVLKLLFLFKIYF